MPPLSERVARLAAARMAGQTLQEIADAEGITRQRVAQILRRAQDLGETDLPSGQELRRARANARYRPLYDLWVARGYGALTRTAREAGVHPAFLFRWAQARGLPRPARDPRTGAHGTMRRYRAGCRCAPCRRANTAYHRRARARRAASPPTPES